MYLLALAVNPVKAGQFAVGLSDGKVYVMEPPEAGLKWSTLVRDDDKEAAGTSGVGEYTLKKFARSVPRPRVYIVGRSQEAADRIVLECEQINPGGRFEFIKGDVSILKNVDDVCGQIKKKEPAINILFQSQGTMAFKSSKAAVSQCHSIMPLVPFLLRLMQVSLVLQIPGGCCAAAL